MSNSINRISINQATTREQWNLGQALTGYARHGAGGVAVWFDKLREAGSAAAAAKLIRDSGLAVSGYCVAGDFSAATTRDRQQMMSESQRMVDEAAAIGAACLVVIGGGVTRQDKDIGAARKRSFDAIAELLPYAREAGVTLALEPLHPMVCSLRSVLSTLAQANDWRQRLGEGTGIAVDTYNVWWDPDLEAQIERAAGHIVAFHVSDWLENTVDVRLDRGMPGDGVINLRHIRNLVERAGYTGFVEVEILSTRDWWKRDPDEVMETITERWNSEKF